MTEREKIIEILKQTSDIWKEEERHGYIVSVDLGKIADELIAAGIGDVSRRSQRYKKKIKRLKATMVQNEEAAREIIFQRTKRAEAAEHRAEVYERALYHTAISDTEYQEAIEQAEKEIAEGNGEKKEV